MSNDYALAYYVIPLLSIWAAYIWCRRRSEAKSRALLAEANATGLNEPASLHPVIDPAKCLGCAACVRACPEGQILGLVDGKARLVSPSECIGHGACRAVCPHGAISLVFGTEKRGVDIPHVKPNFETNVPGLFIAGELGGMGLIRNAVEQGRQAVESVSKLSGLGMSDRYDVAIVGAGPAGMAAALAATEAGLRYVLLEQDTFGGTVSHFPKGKIVMTQPAVLPLAGRMNFREISKESLLAFWSDVAARYRLSVRSGERVDRIHAIPNGFEIASSNGVYRARSVVLAIGRRGTPRRLGVPGEDQSKVVYRLTDGGQYRRQHVLVVGGGDSALEAAASLAEEPGTIVVLSYRGDGFARAKTRNRDRVKVAAEGGSLTVMLRSEVRAINIGHVDIDWGGQSLRLPNDAVIVCAGGVLPTALLKNAGVELETHYGVA